MSIVYFAVLVKTGLSAVWADQHDPHIECIRAKEYLLVISLSQIPSPDCLSGPFFGLDRHGSEHFPFCLKISPLMLKNKPKQFFECLARIGLELL